MSRIITSGGQIKKQSQIKEVWRRLKKSKTAVVALVTVCMLILIAIFADVIAPYSYDDMDLKNKLAYPSAQHLMGTDNFGRDLFSRVIYGARISLLIALLSVSLSVAAGTVLGVTAAYYGGKFETFVMSCMDVFMSIPSILLAISLSTALGAGILTTSIAIACTAIPSFTRVTRAAAISVRNQEYVEAARAVGARDKRILTRHIIPNSLAPIIVQATISIVSSILIISTLSFIGLGVQPPTPEWGSILAAGREYIRDFWPIVTFPGLMITITLISFNLLGDGLRDALDPRLRQ